LEFCKTDWESCPCPRAARVAPAPTLYRLLFLDIGPNWFDHVAKSTLALVPSSPRTTVRLLVAAVTWEGVLLGDQLPRLPLQRTGKKLCGKEPAPAAVGWSIPWRGKGSRGSHPSPERKMENLPRLPVCPVHCFFCSSQVDQPLKAISSSFSKPLAKCTLQ
jgi:hypothetical protein